MKFSSVAVVALSTTALAAPANVLAQDEEHAHHSVDQIIVTAKPLARTVEELAQTVTVLHGHKLINKQTTSIVETMSQEPGVSSTYFGPISSRPVIRGQFGERVAHQADPDPVVERLATDGAGDIHLAPVPERDDRVADLDPLDQFLERRLAFAGLQRGVRDHGLAGIDADGDRLRIGQARLFPGVDIDLPQGQRLVR